MITTINEFREFISEKNNFRNVMHFDEAFDIISKIHDLFEIGYIDDKFKLLVDEQVILTDDKLNFSIEELQSLLNVLKKLNTLDINTTDTVNSVYNRFTDFNEIFDTYDVINFTALGYSLATEEEFNAEFPQGLQVHGDNIDYETLKNIYWAVTNVTKIISK